MKPPTLIVAEDRDEIRDLLIQTFSALGFRVLPATTGNAAFDIFMENEVDLIISDVRMPDGTGIALLRRLRRTNKSDPSKKIPPVIITTGLLDKGEPYLRSLGACDVFLKPFDMQIMIKSVYKHLKIDQARGLA